ncbi:MAG: endonuclease/exonuclease/phosphatase family protein [Alphaproteobacteria bacterium]|jgi:endonuclease/exonuclease/phosphatase family metal-dependent hydrolase|nr:EEP domain-containing protein [Rhodospirillaceae bacterium]MBT6202412.1 EEP domain-containing protein [Rhodospirillaceae bacterium]MBT6510327.1 EEP domain-containing protein [Rhodospirillaceae bacterium]MBT7648773.1 EEP domain-containing protein [Rhodospirillaceae bacterium]MDG2483067.1 endonuclease/exonuclease/phosphatase family protein [Alphaproteobacteria bacterium]
MKFLSYNIQYGIGLDGRYDLSRCARVMQDADVIALQEVERHWPRTNNDDQAALLSQMLPDHHWVYGPGFDMDASQRDVKGRLVNRRRQFGCMLLSRLPIVWSRCHIWPHRRTVTPFNMQGQALEGMIRTAWGPLRVISLHLSHVSEQERLAQIEFLLVRHRETPFDGGVWCGDEREDWANGEAAPDNPLSAIWMGDFNSTPDSTEYHRMVGSSPYHSGALHVDAFHDSTTLGGHQADAFTSHDGPDEDGSHRRRRLDYCFTTADLACRVRGMNIDEAEGASDHKPVWTELDLEGPS